MSMALKTEGMKQVVRPDVLHCCSNCTDQTLLSMKNTVFRGMTPCILVIFTDV
jgi:hypothetical protein